jgi:hypothetical protein
MDLRIKPAVRHFLTRPVEAFTTPEDCGFGRPMVSVYFDSDRRSVARNRTGVAPQNVCRHLRTQRAGNDEGGCEIRHGLRYLL